MRAGNNLGWVLSPHTHACPHKHTRWPHPQQWALLGMCGLIRGLMRCANTNGRGPRGLGREEGQVDVGPLIKFLNAPPWL